MDHETKHQFRRLPKGERRVRFADSMGMELVSIFLFDLISNYYFAAFSAQSAISSSPTIEKNNPHSQPRQHQQLQSSQTIKQIQLQKQQQHQLQLLQQQKQLQQRHQPQPTPVRSPPTIQPSSYICEFTQPISLISFKERVKLNKVHLETCSVSSGAGNVSISCTIRVLNETYEKSVIVRYTTDEWHTHTDSLASYKPGSCDGWSDKFTSTFSVTNQVRQFQRGQRIAFAVRYSTGSSGQVYWDNNGGLDYTLKLV